MRIPAAIVLGLVALPCCAKTLPPDNPSNPYYTESTADADVPPPPERSTLAAADPTQPVTIKDESPDKEARACGGANVADLAAVLSQASCEAKDAKPDEPAKDLKDLEITVAVDAPKVAPGSSANVTVTFHNKGKVALPLDFLVDPEPHFAFEVYTAKGARADKPAGSAPPLPDAVQNAPEPEKTVARVTLAPNGIAKYAAPWSAVKYKWASKDKAKGALPGRGYPQEPSGSLPKGKYVLRVVTPLVGVADGEDHEITQPRTKVEIGNP